MISVLKRNVKYLYHQLVLLGGYLNHVLTGKQSPRAFHAMISIFCIDRGLTSDLYSRVIGFFWKPYRIQKAQGLFGNLDSQKLLKIKTDLETVGYSIADVMVPEEICQKLESLYGRIESNPFRISPKLPPPPPGLYDPNNLVSSTYSFYCQNLVNEEVIQDILADESLLAIANSYLQGAPILDSVIMSVSTDFSKTPNGDAAQLYHFDMDRIKWLKFFLYLSDVDDSNGPHVFIEGTQKTNGIPKALLQRGYARIQDHEVAEHFPKEKIKVFKCRRGTLFVEDTRGLHKGQVLVSGRRLLLQAQYNLGLFGTSNLHPHKIKKLVSPHLKKMIAQYPKVYSNFRLEN